MMIHAEKNIVMAAVSYIIIDIIIFTYTDKQNFHYDSFITAVAWRQCVFSALIYSAIYVLCLV